MASQTIPYITPEEYLEAERKAEFRSEYVDGQIYAMAGTSWWHNVIMMNLSREVSAALKGSSCQPAASDQRLQISAGRYVYPDMMIVCGEPKFAESDLDTLTNPQVIIEVLSGSTEAYDRGAKFGFYRSLPSLQEYLLVSQTSRLVEHFTRGTAGIWKFNVTEGRGNAVTFTSLNIELKLDEIYYNVPIIGD